MPIKKVKCKYCGIEFNRLSEPTVQISERRYAHKECAEKHDAAIPQDEKDYKILEDYIKKIFNINTLGIKIRKQIKDFKEEYKYTYSGMYKTLYWWFDIKKHSIDLANGGIGIVPYVYDEACKYYYSIWLAQQLNNEIQNYCPIVKEIEIGSPRTKINEKKLFNLED